jgi:hypothetical protein
MGNSSSTSPTTPSPANIINEQTNIISVLQDKLSKMQNSVSSSSVSIKEPFDNINPILLNSKTYPKLDDYTNIYNNNIALLDDPNNDTKNTFNAYISLQDNKIQTLRTELDDLQKRIQNNKFNKPNIQAIKSIDNSQILNLEPYSLENKNISSEYPNYLIYGNNGCLQYEKSSIDNNNVLQPSTWSFKSCNANEPKQQFIPNQVNYLSNYNYYIQDPSNKNYILNDANTTTLGFYIMNPITSPNDQCLQLNNEGISVMPCNMTNSQRFKTLYSTIIN